MSQPLESAPPEADAGAASELRCSDDELGSLPPESILDSPTLLSTEFVRTFFPTCYQCRGSINISDGQENLLLANFVKSDVSADWKCKPCQGKTPKTVEPVTPTRFFNELQRRFIQRLIPKVESLNPAGGDCTKLLQEKMRSGTQTREDFSARACEGYVRNKFSQRARFCFQAVFLAVWRGIAVGQSIFGAVRPALSVCSIGGGPANDLFGAMIALETIFNLPPPDKTAMSAAPESVHYHVFDWVDSWEPIIQQVSALSNRPIQFGLCDIRRELNQPTNSAVKDLVANSKDSSFLFLFSFVILESLCTGGASGEDAESATGEDGRARNLLTGLLEWFSSCEKGPASFIILDAGCKAPKTKQSKKRKKMPHNKEESHREACSEAESKKGNSTLHGSLLWLHSLVTQTSFKETYSCELVRLPHNFHGDLQALVITMQP